MAKIILKDVNKIYPNNVHAVYDFNLEINDKEFIVFVGPSGCGKSTTLRMIAGLEEISTGEFSIDGKLTNFVPAKDRNVSMVFQNYALYPHMTVYKNMAYGLRIKKDYFPIYEDNDVINKLLKETNAAKAGIQSVLKKMAKDSDNKDLKAEYMNYFNEVKNKLEEVIKIRKPIIGQDNKRIQRVTDAIGKNQKELTYVKNMIEQEKNRKVEQTKNVEELNKKISHLKSTIGDVNNCDKKDPNLKKLNKLEKDLKLEIEFGYDPELIKMLENDVVSLNKIIDEKTKELEEIKQGKSAILKYRHYYDYEIDYEVYHAADVLDLQYYLSRFPSALSGGQRQRVALGRAIVRRPKVFLMDEPLSNLDAKLRVQTRGEILKLHRRVGATTIYVTHDQTEAMTLADRIVVMKDGYVQQIDSPLVCFEDPTNMFVAGFIGSPSMNFINGKLVGNKFVSDDKLMSLKLSAKDLKALKKHKDDIVLGIRPEHVIFGAKKENNVSLNVESVELLGNESVLYTKTKDNKIAVKVPKNINPNTSGDMKFSFDKDKFYFFDKKTTKRIK